MVDDKRTFRIYRTKEPEKPGPVLLLLHGGGYSGLTWAHFCVGLFIYIFVLKFRNTDVLYIIDGNYQYDSLPMFIH